MENVESRIYHYGDYVKVIWFKNGIHHFTERAERDCDDDLPVFVNDEKLANNISRARSRVLEIALCNPWEWFCTLTIDGEKQDRSDLDGFIRDLGVWIGNFNKKYRCSMKYILVPELHKDGVSWHMHGLLHNVPDEALVRNEFGYLDIPYYRNRFGYISLSAVKDHERVSRYITKYISKSMSSRVADKAKHLFYSSKGLNGRVLDYECAHMPVADGAFEGEYTVSKWFRDSAELAQFLASATE